MLPLLRRTRDKTTKEKQPEDNVGLAEADGLGMYLGGSK